MEHEYNATSSWTFNKHKLFGCGCNLVQHNHKCSCKFHATSIGYLFCSRNTIHSPRSQGIARRTLLGLGDAPPGYQIHRCSGSHRPGHCSRRLRSHNQCRKSRQKNRSFQEQSRICQNRSAWNGCIPLCPEIKYQNGQTALLVTKLLNFTLQNWRQSENSAVPVTARKDECWHSPLTKQPIWIWAFAAPTRATRTAKGIVDLVILSLWSVSELMQTNPILHFYMHLLNSSYSVWVQVKNVHGHRSTWGRLSLWTFFISEHHTVLLEVKIQALSLE